MRLTLLIVAFAFAINFALKSQSFYHTSGGELIFSRSLSNSVFENSSNRTRLSAFFHYNKNYHYNFSEFFGIYAGYSIANIGFIYSQGDTTYKRRAYTLGIPLAFKFGKLSTDHYLFAGGEIEFPFHYKQKRIYEDYKNKHSAFFDRRMNPVLPSLFAGIQFPEGLCFKLKIYLSDFLNKNFEGTDFGVITNYKNLESKIFLISLSYNLKQTKLKKIIKSDNNRYANLNI